MAETSAVNRLSADRDPFGYFTADGKLVLDNANYTILIACARCHAEKQCGWYTGHGQPIRWYCDECAGTACGAWPWESYDPLEKASGPAEVIAPSRAPTKSGTTASQCGVTLPPGFSPARERAGFILGRNRLITRA